MLSGAAVQALATATKAHAISGQFGSTIATRSPRPMPRPFSVEAVRVMSSYRPPYVSGIAAGAVMATAAGACMAIISASVE